VPRLTIRLDEFRDIDATVPIHTFAGEHLTVGTRVTALVRATDISVTGASSDYGSMRSGTSGCSCYGSLQPRNHTDG